MNEISALFMSNKYLLVWVAKNAAWAATKMATIHGFITQSSVQAYLL